jgi:RNA recognition motif-containing protein
MYKQDFHVSLYLTRCRAESKKVFVGGLLAEVTEKEFSDYFGSFGLVKVSLILDTSNPYT